MNIKQVLLAGTCIVIGFISIKANLDPSSWFAAAVVISALITSE